MFSTIAGVGRRFARWRAQRRNSRVLSALSDRTLKDIGIHRSQIGMVARGIDRPHRRGY